MSDEEEVRERVIVVTRRARYPGDTEETLELVREPDESDAHFARRRADWDERWVQGVRGGGG